MSADLGSENLELGGRVPIGEFGGLFLVLSSKFLIHISAFSVLSFTEFVSWPRSKQ